MLQILNYKNIDLRLNIRLAKEIRGEKSIGDKRVFN